MAFRTIIDGKLGASYSTYEEAVTAALEWMRIGPGNQFESILIVEERAKVDHDGKWFFRLTGLTK